MLKPREVANELKLWLSVYTAMDAGSKFPGHDRLKKCLHDGQQAILELVEKLDERDRTIWALETKIAVLEAAAEEEAQKLEAYRAGDDLHGN